MPAADIYSPEPNMLERRFATYLAQRGADSSTGEHPSQDGVQAISRMTRRIIGASTIAGLISGGLIGGAEIWVRRGVFDGMDDVGWREALPYWTIFYVFAAVVSALEIALLYALALVGIARVTKYSGLQLAHGGENGLFSYSLARAALEFPNPQVKIYGIDPYVYVANWKLTALNIAYKLKVGVSSFILRVFLRRVAARMAIRGMVPLFAGPLYAVWNAFIVWRIMTEARVRTMGPFTVDTLVESHFEDINTMGDAEKDVILQAAAEMMACGRDAHPNQIYLLTHLREALKRDERITLDWASKRDQLSRLDSASQARVLDLLTVSCVLGARIRREQMAFLRTACGDCGESLHQNAVKKLRKRLVRGEKVTPEQIAKTRSPA